MCRWVSLKIHEERRRSEVEVGAAVWESEGEENGYRHRVYLHYGISALKRSVWGNTRLLYMSMVTRPINSPSLIHTAKLSWSHGQVPADRQASIFLQFNHYDFSSSVYFLFSSNILLRRCSLDWNRCKRLLFSDSLFEVTEE